MVLCPILLQRFSYRQAVDLNSNRLSPCQYKRDDSPSDLATLLLPTFVSKNRGKFGWFECHTFWLFQTNFLWDSHFSTLNMLPNNVAIQIYFCFPMLYLSPSIRTKIECNNKQLLVDVNWINKAIWKSAFSKAMKDVLLTPATEF